MNEQKETFDTRTNKGLATYSQRNHIEFLQKRIEEKDQALTEKDKEIEKQKEINLNYWRNATSEVKRIKTELEEQIKELQAENKKLKNEVKDLSHEIKNLNE